MVSAGGLSHRRPPYPAHIRPRRSIHREDTRLCNCHLAGTVFDAYSTAATCIAQQMRKRRARRPQKACNHTRSLFTIEALLRPTQIDTRKRKRMHKRHNRALRLPVNKLIVRCANYDNDPANVNRPE